VIEDTITTGSSARKAIDAVRNEGGAVIGVLALVDRQEGGRELLESSGIPVVALTTADDIVRVADARSSVGEAPRV
jgi:orotate phosphoribosyltransferase